jgi:hypothetical protein
MATVSNQGTGAQNSNNNAYVYSTRDACLKQKGILELNGVNDDLTKRRLCHNTENFKEDVSRRHGG